MSLVGNEKAKLSATYLNGVAIALFAVGGLAPLVAGLVAGTILPRIGIMAAGCLAGSWLLHLVGRRILGGLKE